MMGGLRNGLLVTLAGSLSLVMVACGGPSPAPSVNPVMPPTLATPLPTDDGTGDDGYDDDQEEPGGDDTPPAGTDDGAGDDGTGSDAEPTPEPTPTPAPTPTPSPTPTPAASSNPLGNDALEAFGEGKLTAPNGLAISGNEVYVTDLEPSSLIDKAEGRVQVFGTDGNWRRTVMDTSIGRLPVDLTGVAVSGPTMLLSNSTTGDLHTAIRHEPTDKKGFANQVVWSKFGIGTKNDVAALATDSSGFVYVANTTIGAVSKFSSSGAVQSLNFVSGNEQVPFSPVGLAFDSNNRLHIADAATKHIRVVTPDGKIYGDIPTGMQTLGAVAVDKRQGDVYVVDRGRKEIKRFTRTGDVVQTFGAGSLTDPRGLAIDANGTIFVVDGQHGAKKIFRFNPGK